MEFLIDESRILKANLQISPHLAFLQNLLASCNNFGLYQLSHVYTLCQPLRTNGKFILSVKDKVRKITRAREKLPTSEKFFDATSISRMGNASSQSPTTHLTHTHKKRDT